MASTTISAACCILRLSTRAHAVHFDEAVERRAGHCGPRARGDLPRPCARRTGQAASRCDQEASARELGCREWEEVAVPAGPIRARSPSPRSTRGR